MNRKSINLLSVVALAVAILSSASLGEAKGKSSHALSGEDVSCAEARDIQLVNGKILTMDGSNSVTSSVNIKNGRIVAVGNTGDRSVTPCTRRIDLHGRTAIPGIIDNHIHIVAMGRRPGFDTPLDTAASIPEIVQRIRERAQVTPAGEFITCIGGWATDQLSEKRLPTIAELDRAAPNRPVLLVTNLSTHAVTNSLGKAFFESHQVAFANGEIATPAGILRSVYLLKSTMSLEQLKRNTEYAMGWAASVGITTVMDMGSQPFTGTDTDTIGAYDPIVGYDPVLALARENKLKIRYRLNLISWDSTPDLPLLKARLDNSFPSFGNDMIGTACIGESIWTFNGPGGIGRGVPAPAYTDAARMVARRGYCYEQHSLTAESNRAITAVWEEINSTIPLRDLHWRIAHAWDIDQSNVERLKAMGVGIGIISTHKMPLRMILNSGIHVGASSDSRNIFPTDPWIGIQYMVTGKDRSGTMNNPDQTITRMEALRLYTADNGWFLNEEKSLGTIEVGKLGDIVVLSKDYLDTKQVPDDAIGRLTSLLTIVNGKVVHDMRSGPTSLP